MSEVQALSPLAIVLPVFNQVFLTERCLASLLQNSRVAQQIFVIDNGSTVETAQCLQRFQPQFEAEGWEFRVLRIEVNQGFGRACNQGILRVMEGAAPWFAVLNNDTWLPAGWDEILLRRAQELGSQMISPAYDETPFDPTTTAAKLQNYGRRNAGRSVRGWSSILMLFSRVAAQTVMLPEGLFDPRFFLTFEDTDLRERMDRAGCSYDQVGDCCIWHHSKGTRQFQVADGHEVEGLRLFIEKWGFDPRVRDHTRRARLQRRWKKIKNFWGFF